MSRKWSRPVASAVAAVLSARSRLLQVGQRQTQPRLCLGIRRMRRAEHSGPDLHRPLVVVFRRGCGPRDTPGSPRRAQGPWHSRAHQAHRVVPRYGEHGLPAAAPASNGQSASAWTPCPPASGRRRDGSDPRFFSRMARARSNSGRASDGRALLRGTPLRVRSARARQTGGLGHRRVHGWLRPETVRAARWRSRQGWHRRARASRGRWPRTRAQGRIALRRCSELV